MTYDLVVVGGGPAGLTAAVYAIRKRLDVLLVSQDLGGKTNYYMNLPDQQQQRVIRGTEVVDKFRRELEYLEFARRQAAVARISRQDNLFTVTTTGGTDLQAKSVILATGSEVKRLNVPGERDYLGRGVSYSAVSYAQLFIDKKTVVVGDDKLALRAVAELAQSAAAVTLVAPGQGALNTPLGQKLLADDKVQVLAGYKVKAIRGQEYAQRVILETPDGHETEVQADGIFVELGLVPNSGAVKGLADLDETGRVKIDRLNYTSVPGLFAAGDVTNAYAEQVLIAIGEGAKAALSAYEYIFSL
jgi:alkyl hydroperoxide reductase subunit F